MGQTREYWIDYTKTFACVLVVLGHFFQSMVKAGIIADSSAYQWFNTTIYYFHVPLFFICSGYLHQRYSVVNDFSSWKKNVFKKALTLGIPYFVFSFATWLLKVIFPGSVNIKTEGLLTVLFFQPLSPYWYLYTLFFMFLITPTMRNKTKALLWLLIALSGKIISIFGGGTSVYAISHLLANYVWFVFGMFLGKIGTEWLAHRIKGSILFVAFLAASFFFYQTDNGLFIFLFGIWACIAVLMIFCKIPQIVWLDSLVRNTMPIFLMHTICAASFRAVLMKAGIHSPLIHISLGITVSFIGPVLSMYILRKIKLDFLVFPGKRFL